MADAVNANLLAAGAPAEACGRAYNVAGGRRTTIMDYAPEVELAEGLARASRHHAALAGLASTNAAGRIATG